MVQREEERESDGALSRLREEGRVRRRFLVVVVDAVDRVGGSGRGKMRNNERIPRNETSVERKQESIRFVLFELDDDVVRDSKAGGTRSEEGWLLRGRRDGVGWW